MQIYRKNKISMVDSTKSSFAPYVMARLALSHSRDSDRGAASQVFSEKTRKEKQRKLKIGC